MFIDLKERGLRDIELVTSDGHKGIQKAVEREFLGASWQMYHVHLERTILEKLPRKYHKEAMEMFKEV